MSQIIQAFLNIVNMSISASFIVLVVLLLRFILKKVPKWITVALWGIVAIRLVCPFFIESELSLIPETEWIEPPQALVSPITPDTIVTDAVIGENVTVEHPQEEPNITVKKSVAASSTISLIWLAGILGLLIYTIISYARLNRKIGTAVLCNDNVYQSESVVSPFVLGIIKPKIYLPFNINEKDMEYVVAHEKAHIRRGDHLWKPLGFLLLTIHWFNPILWLGYILLCRDIELACDEKVIKELDHDARADYSEALLSCSVNRRMISACPLAFGEVGVKDRVKSVLNYKKPAFWIIIIAILACVSVAVCFLTDPIGTDTSVNDGLKAFIDTQVLEHFRTEKSEGNACCFDWIPLGKTERGSETTVYMWVMYQEYSYIGTELEMETAAHIPTAITVKEENGQYELVEYWEPENGANYPTSLKRKFPRNILNSEAFTSRLYSEEQTEKCLKQARIYFGLDHISGTQSERGLICSFLHPNSTSGKMHYVYIQDFGCNVADVRIDFKEVRFENGEIVFAIYWENNGTKDVDIGPDFEVYKYKGTSLEKLEHKNVWLYYRQSVAGKGTYVAGDLDGLTIANDTSVPYSVSAHYDIFSPGRYRFEAHGAWVDFQIIDDYSKIAPEYDIEFFDVDGDGEPEQCSMHSGLLGNYQNFVFIVKDPKTGKTECETLIYSQVRDLSFARWIDNTVRVKGRTPDKNPMEHWFEISIVDGNVCLTEKGLPIEEVGKVSLIYDDPVYSYVMPPEAVPKIEIENGIIYTVSEGKMERYGTVKAVDITYDNFDSFTKISEHFTSPALLRGNNETAYEVTPDSVIGIGLYYIMEQKNGETLIVYGHYEDGKKVGAIRFIYSVKE